MRCFRTSWALGFGIVGGLVVAIGAAGPSDAHTSALYETTYTIHVRNDSNSFENFAVYQTDPDLPVANSYSLAWIVKGMLPSAKTDLSWNPDYSFSLSDSADLKAGVIYRSDQTLLVSPGTPGEDGVDLTYARDILGMVRAKSTNHSNGMLSLEEPRTTPRTSASVALGMAGRPAFAWKAEPNHSLSFTPHPEYWITAGTFTQGEVINPRTVLNPLRLQLGTKAVLTVTLHQGGRWTIS